MSFPRLVLLRAGAVAVALTATALTFGGLPGAAAPITVVVAGAARTIPSGTTLGGLLRTLDLGPLRGRLLALDGGVLERRATPGHVYLNSLSAPRATILHDGDRILLVDGADRTEGTRKVVTPVDGRRPSDPQFTLATWPMERITIEGRRSGDAVSVTFRPTGRPRRPREVALTFDDGPWPRSTRRILGVLRRKHVRATFFLVGSLAARYPGIVRDLVRAGMVIGNHSWDHPSGAVFARLPDHRVWTEMGRTNRVLERFGISARLFRPPGGSYDDDLIQTARQLGMRVVLWDVDARDWRDPSNARDIARAVLRRVHPGSIVLLHDGGGRQPSTAAALVDIIEGIRRRGLRLVPLR